MPNDAKEITGAMLPVSAPWSDVAGKCESMSDEEQATVESYKAIQRQVDAHWEAQIRAEAFEECAVLCERYLLRYVAQRIRERAKQPKILEGGTMPLITKIVQPERFNAVEMAKICHPNIEEYDSEEKQEFIDDQQYVLNGLVALGILAP